LKRKTLQTNIAVNGLYDTKLCGSNTVYCLISKDVFPGLSRSWNFQEKNSRTFQEAWEPWC